MTAARDIPLVSARMTRALNAAAMADGIPVDDLLEQALERELKRREKRRALIARNRRVAVFPMLQARTD